MTNARKSAVSARTYRAGYLKSDAWHARRSRFFKENRERGRYCAVCRGTGTAREFELHHLSYRGVSRTDDGRWRAYERDEDLMPMHPACHAAVHRVIERDEVLSDLYSRKAATQHAIARVRARLTRTLGEWTARK